MKDIKSTRSWGQQVERPEKQMMEDLSQGKLGHKGSAFLACTRHSESWGVGEKLWKTGEKEKGWGRKGVWGVEAGTRGKKREV